MASITENTLIRDLNPDMTIGDLVEELREAGITRRDDFEKRNDSTVGKIIASLKLIDRTVMDLAEPWAKVDAAASKFAKTIGATKKGLEDLRRDAMRNVAKGNLGFEFNMSADELIEAQQSYIKGIGRSVKLGLDDSKTLAAITSVFGDSSEMFTQFDKFGVSMEGIGTHMGKMFSEASKSGISLDKYAQNVKQGLEMANKYTFRDGLKGMEAMAKRAAAIKMDMQQVESFAGSFDTIENSLQNAAKLQVLGGQFASGADALGLLNDSLNDIESLQKRMEGFTQGMGVLNKQTGEVEISSFNRMRMQQYAKITGQDFGKVMEVARRQSMRGEIEAQLNANSNPALKNKDFQELIKNTATFKDGKAGVTVDGDFKELSKLTEKDQEKLIKETQTQSEDIKDIAKDVRSLADMRSGVKKQYENVQARTVGSFFGNISKGLTRLFTGSGAFGRTILGLGVGLATFGKLGGAWKGLKGIWKGFGGGGSGSVNNSPESILRRLTGKGTKAGGKGAVTGGKGVATGAKAAKSVIPKGGKAIVSSAGKSYTQVGTRVFNSAGKEVFGAAKSSVLKGATAKGGAEIGRRGAKRAATRAAIKIGGKGAAKIGTKLAAGAAKGGPAGIIGAVGNIATDMLVDSGKIKKGGGAHMAMKVGSTALEGAALGSMIGSVIPGIGNAVGAAVGAVAGAAIGAIKVQKVRNGQVVDAQLEKLGIERKGDYGARRLSKIDKALQTGKMSNATRRKLLRKGDAAIVEQIEAVKKQKDAEKEAKREKRRERKDKRLHDRAEIAKSKLKTAHFEVGTAYFGGRAIGGGFGAGGFGPIGVAKKAINVAKKLNPLQIIKPFRKENGASKEMSILETLKLAKEKRFGRRELDKESSRGPVDVKVDGTIKLEIPGGAKIDLMAEIKKDPKLLSQLTQEIVKRMNVEQYGGYRSDRTFGNNPV